MPRIGVPFSSLESIMGLSWFAVDPILSLPLSFTSHAQPEPKRSFPAVVNCSLNLSNEPKAPLIASDILPVGAPPPLGFITSQKKLWFHAPPPLFFAFADNFDALAKNSFSLAAVIFSAAMASFTFLMYAV